MKLHIIENSLKKYILFLFVLNMRCSISANIERSHEYLSNLPLHTKTQTTIFQEFNEIKNSLKTFASQYSIEHAHEYFKQPLDKAFHNINSIVPSVIDTFIFKIAKTCKAAQNQLNNGIFFFNNHLDIIYEPINFFELSSVSKANTLLGPTNEETFSQWIQRTQETIDTLSKQTNQIVVSLFQEVKPEIIEILENNDKNKAVKFYESWYMHTIGSIIPWQEFVAHWTGNTHSPSRIYIQNYLKKHSEYQSILDIPCGLCVDFFGFRENSIKIEYVGMDINPNIVKQDQQNGLNVKIGNIEKIPIEDNSFDVTYCRWCLENLSSYKLAVTELIRVAKNEVIIVFFRKPTTDPDQFRIITWPKPYLYFNIYNKENMEKFITQHPKVRSIIWQDIKEHDNETVLHVYLRD